MPNFIFKGIPRQVLVEFPVWEAIREMRFDHFTGKLIMEVQEGHITNIQKEEVHDAPKEG